MAVDWGEAASGAGACGWVGIGSVPHEARTNGGWPASELELTGRNDELELTGRNDEDEV